MKKLENKQTEVLIGENKKATYADLIKIILDVTPAGGYKGYAMMEQRFKIADLCNTATEVIDFEDADAKCVKELVLEMSWSNKHADLIMFMKDIEKL